MLTPKFEIEQCSDFVLLDLIAPYTKVNEVEINIDCHNFVFHARPYLLRLHFSHEIVEGGSSCRYDVDAGKYSVKIKKASPGQHFHGLDLLTSLLIPKKQQPAVSTVEVFSCGNELRECSIVEIDWHDVSKVADSKGFGFADKLHLEASKEIMDEILSIKNPSNVGTAERCIMREESEQLKFDPNHYLADLYEREEIDKLLYFKPWWNENIKITFSSCERDIMRSLPNREYLLDCFERRMVYLGLVDLLFAYAYNHRITEGEDNVESAWNIRNISSMLSWCHVCSDIQHALITNYRRILALPLYRSFKLADCVKRDVASILAHGMRSVLRCLLHIFILFQEDQGNPSYVLNDLYITDYSVWLQNEVDCDEVLTSLSSTMQSINIKKADLNLELEIIEQAAILALHDSDVTSDDVIDGVAAIEISKA